MSSNSCRISLPKRILADRAYLGPAAIADPEYDLSKLSDEQLARAIELRRALDDCLAGGGAERAGMSGDREADPDASADDEDDKTCH